MAKVNLKKVSKLMSGIDLCMLTTVDGRGRTSSRPMSNNGDVGYEGTSYYFTCSDRKMVREIKKNPAVSLQFVNSKLLSKTFISVTGKAKLIVNREQFEKHWTPELKLWFKDGVDTKGLVMIEVAASHIKYWKGREEGEYSV